MKFLMGDKVKIDDDIGVIDDITDSGINIKRGEDSAIWVGNNSGRTKDIVLLERDGVKYVNNQLASAKEVDLFMKPQPFQLVKDNKLTRREQFAMASMHGLLANGSLAIDEEYSSDLILDIAIHYADQLIEKLDGGE